MDFWEKLKNSTVLFDGAMGTFYTEKHGHEPEYCEFANLFYSERIESIHREYIAAGCDAIKTNTFGANTDSLDCDMETVFKIIDSGWKIASSAAHSTEVSVFADIGPIPHSENGGNTAQYIKIADRFLSLGAENFLFETFSSANGLDKVFEHIKAKKPTSRIICSFAVSPDGFTREGVALEQLCKTIRSNKNVDVFGLNCVCGPNHMVKLISEIGGGKPIIAMPNAGYPTIVGSRTYFENNAAYYARGLLEIVGAGAQIIGGCCGTTPEHIAKIRKLLAEKTEKPAISAERPAIEIEAAENTLWKKLDAGKKIIAVELDPPANSDIRAFMNGARALRDAGADAITIADCPVSRARADSSLLACKLKRELNIDAIPHMTCRDRNIIATKALLLGLNIEGVNNVLVVTGDPVPTAERGIIKSVFNFNSVVLASFIHGLEKELSRGPFRVFGALNLNAVNFTSQLGHAKKKLENGVDGFFTQPIHSPRALENLKIARNELSGKILGGVMPIVSYRNACFMNSEISGISVCDEIAEQYKGLDKDASSRLAVSLTSEIVKSMAPFVDGYYMITPFMRTDLITEIIANIQ
ncbi:MAG: bifunctional homocysteine S-methyltransferase/methylenetetrahydrofolate reductase [Oscillospiraceae bacterium]